MIIQICQLLGRKLFIDSFIQHGSLEVSDLLQLRSDKRYSTKTKLPEECLQLHERKESEVILSWAEEVDMTSKNNVNLPQGSPNFGVGSNVSPPGTGGQALVAAPAVKILSTVFC